jgi:hypothetical protein
MKFHATDRNIQCEATEELIQRARVKHQSIAKVLPEPSYRIKQLVKFSEPSRCKRQEERFDRTETPQSKMQ